jgi:hypothetical protein
MPRRHWTTQDGRQIPIKDMDLGHLSNTIRMLGENLSKARAAGDKRDADRLEGDLMALQDEYDSRGEEIAKGAGIMGALLRSAHGKPE